MNVSIYLSILLYGSIIQKCFYVSFPLYLNDLKSHFSDWQWI